MDPTVGMLTRLLHAAGQGLEMSARSSTEMRLADLADAWSTDRDGRERPDWTRLRAFLDALALAPDLAGPATLAEPGSSGSPLIDNLLAGIAEKICDDAGIPRPPWARRVPSLKEEWSSPGTPRMRAEAAAATPEQLRRRRIVLRTESLWRDPASVGLT